MFNRNLIIHLKYYLIIFFLFYSADLLAQNIPFKHLTTENGLSNNKILDVIQDKTGFIWLATDDGLIVLMDIVLKFIVTNQMTLLPYQIIVFGLCLKIEQVLSGLEQKVES